MWYIVVFKLPSAETLILSLKFDQFDPYSQMTQKVCQKSAIKTEKTQKFWVNSEILSRLGALFTTQRGFDCRVRVMYLYLQLFTFCLTPPLPLFNES